LAGATVDRGEPSGQAPKGRLLQTFGAWSGQHPARPARVVRGEPVVLRIIAPLALVLMAALIVCAGLGYVLASQSDDAVEAERRRSLTAMIETLQRVSPGFVDVDPKLIADIERASGLNDLRFEAEPAAGNRDMQSVLDSNGRILGWFSWEPERPATAMMHRLLPLATLIALGLGGFAALAMWQLNRLGYKLARSEQQVQKLECEDALTGLPNHNYFFELFDEVLATRKDGETLAFLSLDLDGFDEVNDVLGYGGGDEILMEIGGRLAQAMPEGTIVGRLGSDEFGLLARIDDPDAVLQMAHGLRQVVARPIWANQAIHVAAGIGCAVSPRDGTVREELTRRADLALRAAKRRGRGSAVAFAPEMEAEFQERRFIKREIARSLAGRAFELHYQPIVAAETGAITGVEALLRWNHPTRGAIPPSVFIPIAEEAGLMDRLGEFVLRRAIADAERWPGLYVSVNLSPLQVRDRAFIDLVASVLADSGFEHSRLVLEVTEGVLIDNPEETQARLSELRALGVRLALDDFGSGYSNLGYLQHLPFDKLKIDRSFVASLDKSANAGVIIQAMVTLGRALGMGVVIEGVETEEQRVLLRLAGCNEMQGYLFAKPTTADAISRLVAGPAVAAEVAANALPVVRSATG
jgi:diguanylate cyclase (GGDEF)-like protein